MPAPIRFHSSRRALPALSLLLALTASAPVLAARPNTPQNSGTGRIHQLEERASRQPATYRSTRQYLEHARLLANEGRTQESLNLLRSWQETDISFRDYILMEQARLLSSSGHRAEAIPLLRRLISEQPGSCFAPEARLLLPSLLESQNLPAEAADAWHEAGRALPKESGRAAVAEARLLLVAGRREEAAHLLESLLKGGKGLRAHHQAALLVARDPGLLATCLREPGRLKDLAETLLSNREIETALPLIQELRQSATDPIARARAEFWTGRALFLSGRAEEALPWLQKAQTSPEDSIRIPAGMTLSRAYSFLGRDGESATVLRGLLATSLPSGFRGDMAILLANTLRRLGQDQAAETALQDGLNAAAGTARARFLHRLGMFRLRQKRWEEASRFFSQTLALLPAHPRGDLPDPVEAAFFLGVAEDGARHPDGALEAWLRSPWDPENFYSHAGREQAISLLARTPGLAKRAAASYRSQAAAAPRKRKNSALSALARLYALPGYEDEAGRLLSTQAGLTSLRGLTVLPAAAEDLMPPPDSGPARSLFRAQTFQRLGLAAAASLEYSRLSPGFMAKAMKITPAEAVRRLTFTLARMGELSGDGFQAYRQGHHLLALAAPGTPLPLIPREILRFCYPAPYQETVLDTCRKANVDPHLAYALAYQESRFDEDAHSPNAARGLLQLLPSTAREAARAAGLPAPEGDDSLYDPNQNLRLGIHHIRQLLTALRTPAAAAAAYNAGAAQAAYWKSLSWEPEEYYLAPEVTFAQTRDYVVQVLAHTRMYAWLWPEFRLQ